MALWYEEKIKACSCSDSKRWWFRKIISEFLGTFVFVFISCCSVANVNAFSNLVPVAETVNNANASTIYYDSASILYINFGIAFGYAIGLYISIENDGYLNMALTIIFRFMGKLDNIDTFCLLIGQFFGAFCAALLTWGVYYDQLNFKDVMSQVIFCSIVNGDNYGIAAFDEFLKASLFTIGVLAILDGRKYENEDQPVKTVKPPKSFEPLMIGVVLFIVGVAFSFRTPFYFNPLQDFGGRLAATAAGCEHMCTNKNPIWWPIIPICVPVLGACCAALIYIFFVENNHIFSSSSQREGDEDKKAEKRQDTAVDLEISES